jgi:TRAP-type C4-dicarboxylate transport system substrate-binding protein
MKRLYFTLLSAIIFLSSTTFQAEAGSKYLFKIGSLAPAGSVWVQQFEKFGAEVKKKTGGEVRFRVYPGGVMGDDQAMYRKMRVGQLHGGGFTMTGIARIVPDFRVMAIPFLFNSYKEIDYTLAGLLPVFQKKFQEKRLELVAMTEVGFIYAMSTKPVATISDLRNSSNWSPAGDPVSESFLAALDISPVQLSIPDVLSSLQSGLVDTVYNSLYGSIVLQWFTKARYITDVPYGYAYGVFLLDGRAFAKLPGNFKKIIHDAAAKHFPALLKNTRASNLDSRKVLEKRGVVFVKTDMETIHRLREKRDEAVRHLMKKSLSPEIYTKTTTLLSEFREKQSSGKGPESN